MSQNPEQTTHLIQELADDLGIDPSFLEKDWYAMRVMGALAKIEHPNLQLAFSGGTSLSKGFDLIQRFSEDIDFKINMPEKQPGRSQRRTFRNLVLDHLQKNSEEWQPDLENVISGNGSKFFRLQILYPAQFPSERSLRPHIQLEVSFAKPALATQNRPLQSFVGKALGQEPEAVSFPCISPIETAANKISALTWRVLSRDRTNPNDDPTLVRHLHDLAAIAQVVESSPDFVALIVDSMTQDQNRAQYEQATDTPVQKLETLMQTLSNDGVYAEEYDRFVLRMSYDKTASRLTFSQSMKRLGQLIEGIAPEIESHNESRRVVPHAAKLTPTKRLEAKKFLDSYLQGAINSLIVNMEKVGEVIQREDGSKSYESSAFSWNLKPDGSANITRLADGQTITPQTVTSQEMNAIKDFIIAVYKNYTLKPTQGEDLSGPDQAPP